MTRHDTRIASESGGRRQCRADDEREGASFAPCLKTLSTVGIENILRLAPMGLLPYPGRLLQFGAYERCVVTKRTIRQRKIRSTTRQQTENRQCRYDQHHLKASSDLQTTRKRADALSRCKFFVPPRKIFGLTKAKTLAAEGHRQISLRKSRRIRSCQR